MGRYITWADVSNKYGDFAKGGGALESGSYWIPQAEAEVDGRLAVKYSVPFSPAPDIVKDLSIDLAYCKATLRQEGTKVKEYVDQRFKDIIAGTLVLTTSAGVVQTSGGTAWASNSYHSSFGLDNEVNWRVDSNAVYDLQSARGQVP
jgi:phage gp36-like protein